MRLVTIPSSIEQIEALAVLLGDTDWRPDPIPLDSLSMEEARFLLQLLEETLGFEVCARGDRVLIGPIEHITLGLLAGISDLNGPLRAVLEERLEDVKGETK